MNYNELITITISKRDLDFLLYDMMLGIAKLFEISYFEVRDFCCVERKRINQEFCDINEFVKIQKLRNLTYEYFSKKYPKNKNL